MSWNNEKETAFRLWIRQIVSLSFLYMRAAKSSRWLGFFAMVLATIGTVFTIPGYGCGLVTGEVCIQLQWSGIILSVIVGVNNILSAVYDPSGKTGLYDRAAKDLMKLSRKIDAELAKDLSNRMLPDVLRQEVIDGYDDIVDHIRLPWFIRGERQLANISLLQSYNEVEEGKNIIEVNQTDIAVMDQIKHELRRIDSNLNLK